jgi:Tfp pilus assembly protein PilN
MAVQFNLLPDVKLEYLKAERTRRVVLSVSVLIAIASVGLLFLLFSVTQLQKKHLGDLSSDIKKESTTLESQKDVSKILTVQNQLNSLTTLHDQKPAATRVFSYLTQVVPEKINITNLVADFTQNSITITGTADSLTNVNKFIDTLKFTNFTTEDSEDKSPAFNNVVLTSFGLTQNLASYTVTFNYDPAIFNITKDTSLVVPKLVTTRSEVEKPSELFVTKPATEEGQ